MTWSPARRPMLWKRRAKAARRKLRRLRSAAALASIWAGCDGTAWVRRLPRPYPAAGIERVGWVGAPIAAAGAQENDATRPRIESSPRLDRTTPALPLCSPP
jgi:hypothetical protein